MSRQHRLSKLEAAAPSKVPDADVGRHCLACLGPGGYRRTIDLMWRPIAAGDRSPWSLECIRCGKDTMAGAVVRIRTERGLDP
jgi:hypothetical protein